MPHSNKTFQNMIATYNETGSVVIGTDLVPMEKTKDFGVLQFVPTEKEKVVSVQGFVEKPKFNPPSNLINNGYAVLPPQFWSYLENASGTVGDGEIRVADAYIKMLEDGQKLYAVQPTVPGYDCGNQLGFLKATVDFALQREDLRAEFLEFLRGVVK